MVTSFLWGWSRGWISVESARLASTGLCGRPPPFVFGGAQVSQPLDCNLDVWADGNPFCLWQVHRRLAGAIRWIPAWLQGMLHWHYQAPWWLADSVHWRDGSVQGHNLFTPLQRILGATWICGTGLDLAEAFLGSAVCLECSHWQEHGGDGPKAGAPGAPVLESAAHRLHLPSFLRTASDCRGRSFSHSCKVWG